MKNANDYKAWYRNNDPQNARKDFKEYNRPFSERYKRPPEYVRRGEEYTHFSERYDYTQDQEKETSSEERNNQDKQNNASKSKAQGVTKSIVKTVVGNAVAVVVGAVVLVTGYNATKANNARVYNATWAWSDDCHNVVLKLESDDLSVRQQFNIVSELTEEVLPTCVNDGHRLYSATGKYKDVTYNDQHNEVLHAHGHSFDEGHVVGDYIEYTCANCGEHLIVNIDIEEI